MKADKTWASFKQVFAEKYCDLVKETTFTSRDARFHSANSMQYIGEAINHIAMTAVADKDIVTKLTEAVEVLTRNNASLTTQLSNAMTINLDMAKKLNLEATQAQKPEDKRLVDK